jgi:hypothetical protein
MKFDDRGTAEVFDKRDLSNRKPYRTRAQKIRAKAEARKQEDGAFRCWVPVTFHA